MRVPRVRGIKTSEERSQRQRQFMLKCSTFPNRRLATRRSASFREEREGVKRKGNEEEGKERERRRGRQVTPSTRVADHFRL